MIKNNEARYPVENTLDELFSFDFFDIKIFADSKEFYNSLDPAYVSYVFAAHHEAYMRFLRTVQGEDINSIDPQSFPKANIVFTKDKKVFKDLYHTPTRFDNLPEWFKGYINFKISAYVVLIDDDFDFSYSGFDGTCHEFTHAIIPDVIGVPAEYLEKVWGTWINEAFAVGINQRQSDEWMKEELGKDKYKDISIEGISSNGIFYYDKRKPNENLAYQYCVRVAEELGKAILSKRNYAEDSRVSPLFEICLTTSEAYWKDFDFWDHIEELGISIEDCEKSVREILT